MVIAPKLFWDEELATPREAFVKAGPEIVVASTNFLKASPPEAEEAGRATEDGRKRNRGEREKPLQRQRCGEAAEGGEGEEDPDLPQPRGLGCGISIG